MPSTRLPKRRRFCLDLVGLLLKQYLICNSLHFLLLSASQPLLVFFKLRIPEAAHEHIESCRQACRSIEPAKVILVCLLDGDCYCFSWLAGVFVLLRPGRSRIVSIIWLAGHDLALVAKQRRP